MSAPGLSREEVASLARAARELRSAPFPTGADFQYWSLSPAFSSRLSSLRSRVDAALASVPDVSAPPGEDVLSDPDDLLEWACDALDGCLERLDAALAAREAEKRDERTNREGAAASEGGIVPSSSSASLSNVAAALTLGGAVDLRAEARRRAGAGAGAGPRVGSGVGVSSVDGVASFGAGSPWGGSVPPRPSSGLSGGSPAPRRPPSPALGDPGLAAGARRGLAGAAHEDMDEDDMGDDGTVVSHPHFRGAQPHGLSPSAAPSPSSPPPPHVHHAIFAPSRLVPRRPQDAFPDVIDNANVRKPLRLDGLRGSYSAEALGALDGLYADVARRGGTAPFPHPFAVLGLPRGGAGRDVAEEKEEGREETEQSELRAREHSLPVGPLSLPLDAASKTVSLLTQAVSSHPSITTPSAPVPPRHRADTPFSFVDTEEGLRALCARLGSSRELAIDLEAHNERSFRGFCCLVQISSRDEDAVVDALALRGCLARHLGPLVASPDVLKVFHGAGMDVTWLQRDFGIYPACLFDTAEAARALALPSAALAHLLETLCGEPKDCSFQRYDWRIRPLRPRALEYARGDTHSLLYVYDVLRERLRDVGPDAFFATLAASARVASRVAELDVTTPVSFLKFLGKDADSMPRERLPLARELFNWRDDVCRRADEGVGHVLSRAAMLKVVSGAPIELWRKTLAAQERERSNAKAAESAESGGAGNGTQGSSTPDNPHDGPPLHPAGQAPDATSNAASIGTASIAPTPSSSSSPAAPTSSPSSSPAAPSTAASSPPLQAVTAACVLRLVHNRASPYLVRDAATVAARLQRALGEEAQAECCELQKRYAQSGGSGMQAGYGLQDQSPADEERRDADAAREKAAAQATPEAAREGEFRLPDGADGTPPPASSSIAPHGPSAPAAPSSVPAPTPARAPPRAPRVTRKAGGMFGAAKPVARAAFGALATSAPAQEPTPSAAEPSAESRPAPSPPSDAASSAGPRPPHELASAALPASPLQQGEASSSAPPRPPSPDAMDAERGVEGGGREEATGARSAPSAPVPVPRPPLAEPPAPPATSAEGVLSSPPVRSPPRKTCRMAVGSAFGAALASRPRLDAAAAERLAMARRDTVARFYGPRPGAGGQDEAQEKEGSDAAASEPVGFVPPSSEALEPLSEPAAPSHADVRAFFSSMRRERASGDEDAGGDGPSAPAPTTAATDHAWRLAGEETGEADEAGAPGTSPEAAQGSKGAAAEASPAQEGFGDAETVPLSLRDRFEGDPDGISTGKARRHRGKDGGRRGRGGRGGGPSAALAASAAADASTATFSPAEAEAAFAVREPAVAESLRKQSKGKRSKQARTQSAKADGQDSFAIPQGMFNPYGGIKEGVKRGTGPRNAPASGNRSMHF